jgi:hypothetical protein
MFLDGWMDGWMGGWVGGCKSRFKDCLQQSKIVVKRCLYCVIFEIKILPKLWLSMRHLGPYLHCSLRENCPVLALKITHSKELFDQYFHYFHLISTIAVLA